MTDVLQLIRENQEKYARGEDATRLDIGNCGLTELPDELFACVWLEELILSDNWGEWNVTRKGWQRFESQNKGGENVLSQLDARFAGFSNLKKLVVEGKHSNRWGIMDLGPLKNLAGLTALYANNNQITSLEPLRKLSGLTALCVNNNQITSLGPLKNLSGLVALSISYNQITNLEPLKNLPGLVSLYINNNQIKSFAPLKNLTNLASLYASNNQITSLLSLKSLSGLVKLDVGSNQITSLEPLKNLSNLANLDARSNQIPSLEPLKNLVNFTSLVVESNQITSLEPLKSLSNLASLDARSNQIRDIEPLKNLSNLAKINISNNQITTLEPLLVQIDKGLNLALNNFHNNPWEHPPSEIVKQGREAILNYFAELKQAGEVKGLEAKVIFIGEGQSGKTSLRTRLLQGEEALLPDPDQRTRGLEVEIEPLLVELRSGEQMRLNIFDFGGQTHYKPLHQFFYSHRSLYVLVTRNGDDSNEFDFWFDTAQLFGGGSPVLVVNNLFGDVQSGFNRGKFARFDAIIKDSLNANLLTSDGLPAVRKRIEQLAEELPHIHQTIPKTWANVRRDIEKLHSRNIIHLDEYLAICAKPENGEMDRERALFCSAYLHDIGVCLHYQHFPSLRRYLIVKNEWATEAVYRVMDDPEVNKAHGHFSMSDLIRIWKPTADDRTRGEDFRYEDYLAELLELMREFKLCYPLRLDTKAFVAPHLLPTKRDGDQKWLPDRDLQFEMEYDFMPPGLFSRFVVSRYEDIAGENRDLVWRDEVFFQWDNATANVSLPSRAGKKAIVFKVQGRDPEERKLLLTSLLRDLKKLHTETPGIVAEEKIPCICPKCSDSMEKQFFEHSVLKEFLQAGDDDIQCQKSRKMVSARALLGNIFSDQKPADLPPALDKALIRDLLKTDDLNRALALVEQHAPDECVLLQANIVRIRRSFTTGIATQEDEAKIRRLTIQSVLDWLNEQR